MNAYVVVLKPAKAELTLFVLSVVIATSAVLGLAKLRAEKEQSILQTGQQLAAARDNIKKLTFDLDSIKRLTTKYQRLTRLGFVGEPDRDGWVQRLEAIYRNTRLPPNLRYTLAPPQLFHPQPLADEMPTAYLNRISHHGLNLELSGIHEIELIDLIEKLNNEWHAAYRTEACQIARDEANEPLGGLQIHCTLELFSLPDKPTPVH